MDRKPPAAFAAPHWDVPQTLAWIVYRDPERAAAASEREHRDIKPFGLAATLLEVYGSDPGAALNELRATLAGGALVCLGKPHGGGHMVEIPSDQWADLEFATTDRGTATMGLTDPLAPQSCWTNLCFRRSDVLRVWPISHPIRKAAEMYRAKRIERFTARQRRSRQWIGFAEIAEWCSEVENSTRPDEAAREIAFERLERDLLNGVFDRGGRPRVLYLNTATPKARMTATWLRDIIDYDYDGARGRRSYLPHCWISAEAFRNWCLRHHLPSDPPRFAPLTHVEKRHRGAPPKADWPALEEAFLREVGQRGLPESLNDDGWRWQADVERWIADMLVRERVEVGETTLKKRARQFLATARRAQIH